MATPISNDKILPSDSAHTSVSSGKKSAEQDGAKMPDTGNPTITSNDTTGIEATSVDVERANQIFSQAHTASGEGSISNPEQASLVVADLRGQMEENGSQALRAQAGSASVNLAALLETAPG